MVLPASFTQPGRSALLSVTGPIEMGMSMVFEKLAALPRRFRDSAEVDRRNSELIHELEALRAEITRLKADQVKKDHTIYQLRKLGDNPKLETGYAFYPAQIVSKRYIRKMTGIADCKLKIGIGSNEGVQVDDLVCVESAVIGRVKTVSPYVSEVMLITHPDVCVAAVTSKIHVEGLLTGDGLGRCGFKPRPVRPRLTVGEFVLTSGHGDTHPPGLLLGTVEHVKPAKGDIGGVDVTVRPAFRPDLLHQVIVVRRRGASK